MILMPFVNAGYPSSYTKCKNLTITSISALNDFPVNFNISFDSDMQTDFDDLRFYSGVCGGAGTGTISGSGTTGYIPMFNSTTSINNSALRTDGINLNISLNLNLGTGTGTTVLTNYTINTTTFYGELSWAYLYGHPAPCPSGSWISQLDDSTTCTAPTNSSGVLWIGYSANLNYTYLNSLYNETILINSVNATVTAHTSQISGIQSNITGVNNSLTTQTGRIDNLNLTKLQNNSNANLTSLYIQQNITNVNCIVFINGGRFCGV